MAAHSGQNCFVLLKAGGSGFGKLAAQCRRRQIQILSVSVIPPVLHGHFRDQVCVIYDVKRVFVINGIRGFTGKNIAWTLKAICIDVLLCKIVFAASDPGVYVFADDICRGGSPAVSCDPNLDWAVIIYSFNVLVQAGGNFGCGLAKAFVFP